MVRFLKGAALSVLAGDLVQGALLLVGMNSLRALLLYWGWLILGDAVPGGIRGWAGFGVVLVGIPLSYGVSWAVTGGSGLHFGTGALVSLLSVLLIRGLAAPLKGVLDRGLVMGLVVLSIQWLDLCPSLTPLRFRRRGAIHGGEGDGLGHGGGGAV